MTASVSAPRLRLVALTVVAATVAAACSEQEPAAPATLPAATATTPTSTLPTTNPPATTTAPSTTAAPTTSTTAAPTTTTAPAPSGIPTDVSTPLFAGSSTDAWLYLGRWTGSGWENAFDDTGAPIPSTIADGADVTIAELGQTPVSGTAGGTAEACAVEPDLVVDGPVIAPNAGVPDVPGFGYRAIALPAAWDVHPREAVEVDETIQAYADAGVAAFAGDPVETQAGEVDQTVVVDLDGDGDTEVLVVFGHEAEPVEGQTGPPAGFSALLLLDADSRDGTVVAKSFSALDEGNPAAEPYDSFRVLDVADVNGDGIAEVVVHTWFVDGAGVIVFEYDGATLGEVLQAGCGS